MECPVCGTFLAEGTTVCPQCQSPITNTPLPTTPAPMNQMPANPVPNNNPMDMNQGISVPKDFKFAGGNTDTNGTEGLPDGLASILGIQEEEKAPVTKQKKRRRKLIKTIAFMVLGVIILVIAFLLILGLMPEKVTYDLICTRTENQNGVISESEYKFSDQGGFFNSENKTVMRKEDGSKFTLEDRNNVEQQVGSLGFDQKIELEDGKIIITYSSSHYNVSSVEQVRKESENSGAICK